MGSISHMPRKWPAVAGYRPGSAVDQGGIVGESQGRPRTAQFRVARVLTPGRPVPGQGSGFGTTLGAVASPVLGGLLNAIRPAALRPHSACASNFPLHADTDCRRLEPQMCLIIVRRRRRTGARVRWARCRAAGRGELGVCSLLSGDSRCSFSFVSFLSSQGADVLGSCCSSATTGEVLRREEEWLRKELRGDPPRTREAGAGPGIGDPVPRW